MGIFGRLSNAQGPSQGWMISESCGRVESARFYVRWLLLGIFGRLSNAQGSSLGLIIGEDYGRVESARFYVGTSLGFYSI
jgi:hypothetical protein